MAVYRGRGRCGAIRFQIEAELGALARCNCSLDVRRNAYAH